MNNTAKVSLVAFALLCVIPSGNAEESCMSIANTEFTKDESESEINWQVAIKNDCGPGVNVMLEIAAVDGDRKMLYSTKVAETIAQRGRKLARGNFFVPSYVMSNFKQVKVTIGQVSSNY